MRCSSLTVDNNLSSSQFKPSFTAWNRYVYKGDDVLTLSHRNDTAFARANKGVKNFWENLVDFLAKKYDNKDNIDVVFYGCSDGSESATFVMTVLSRLPKAIGEKFLSNIKAVDFDKTAIHKAKSNIYEINKHEIVRLRNLLGDKVYDYFINFPKMDVEKAEVKLADVVTSKINYMHGDVLDEVKNLNGGSNVVFARAFWSYLEEKVPTLANRMRDNIGDNSTLILHNFDRASCSWQGINIDKLLNKSGFNNSDIDLVFEK